jgi:hypothetical protein
MSPVLFNLDLRRESCLRMFWAACTQESTVSSDPVSYIYYIYMIQGCVEVTSRLSRKRNIYAYITN